MRLWVQSLALLQWVKDLAHVSDLALLWLWWRPAAVTLIQPLAGEPPCATGEALKRKNKKKTRIK